MNIIQRILIACSSIFLYNLIDSQLAHTIIAAGLILIFGIPHGATDHLIDNFNKRNTNLKAISFQFLKGYLLLIGVFLFSWILFPEFSLLVFIMISAYHFGETQLLRSLNLSRGITTQILFFAWGVFLLGCLFLMHKSETIFYLSDILTESTLETAFVFLKPIMLVSTVVFLISYFLVGNISSITWSENFLVLTLDTFLIIAVFFFTDLLFGFSVFFCFWHSLDAISFQIRGFRKKIPSFNVNEFIISALPITLISILGISMGIGIFMYFEININPIILFFIAISSLTLPHTIMVMSFYAKTIYQEQKKRSSPIASNS